MFLVNRLDALVAKQEATAGDIETLIASDGAYNVFNARIVESTSYIARTQQGTVNMLAGTPGPRIGTATFRVEIAGSGSTGGVPLWATTFLPACGLLNSAGTFTRSAVVASQKTVSIAKWTNGVRQMLVGAMGNVVFNFNAGSLNYADFAFTGKYYSETDTTQLDPTEPTVAAPTGWATGTYNSIDINGPTMSLDVGAQLAPIEGKNDPVNSGYIRWSVANYLAKFNCEPYATDLATIDFRGDFVARNQRALSIIIGSSSNNTVTFAGTNAQVTGGPGFGDRAGLATRQVGCDVNGGFTVAFS